MITMDLRSRPNRASPTVKRRTEVVGIFPDEDAVVATLLEQNDEWAAQWPAT